MQEKYFDLLGLTKPGTSGTSSFEPGSTVPREIKTSKFLICFLVEMLVVTALVFSTQIWAFLWSSGIINAPDHLDRGTFAAVLLLYLLRLIGGSLIFWTLTILTIFYATSYLLKTRGQEVRQGGRWKAYSILLATFVIPTLVAIYSSAAKEYIVFPFKFLLTVFTDTV